MIWVLAGTGDSHQLIQRLARLNKELIISVTSNYGKKLYQSRYSFDVYQGKYNLSEMKNFCNSQGIEFILDATHPYAEKASKNAIAAAAELNINYIRYEREKLNLDIYSRCNLIRVKSYQEAAKKASQYDNIFLTTGSKTLKIFIEEIVDYQKRLTVRMLPVIKYLDSVYKSGLQPANIIAAQGPFSTEFNRSVFKEYRADVIVTKATGKTGGLEEKLKAACQLNLPVIMIERPELDYPISFNQINRVIEYLEG